jgi:uncharacterized membrane protein YqgA involved in biofilm formation
MHGTLINTGTALAGSAAGALIGARVPVRIQETFTQVIGLITLFLRIKLAWDTKNPLRI